MTEKKKPEGRIKSTQERMWDKLNDARDSIIHGDLAAAVLSARALVKEWEDANA